MDLGIRGKKALITGGGIGIGRAIALDLAKEGASVFITSRNQKHLSETLKMLDLNKNNHQGTICEISDEKEPQRLTQKVQKEFGNIDIVVNNAGSSLNITDPYCSISDWRKLFRLNLEVPIEINNFCIPYMKANNWGRIVNITAGAALENSGPVTYCSSKAAITAYTRSMGRILAIETKNVIMTAVLPGVILTEEGHWANVLKEKPEHAEKYLKERCPAGRFGKPSEISPMVVLLCSEKATFSQGSIILIDAGQAKHYMYFNYLP
ncbi:MAG: SDR family oxidoreductase [Lutibacter sp.]|jgi:3-oxoacyl-[acyl-carrier protein] reductase